jgi:hypothetical protein
MPIVDPNDLIGCTFLVPEQEDGQQFRACIVQVIDDVETELGQDKDHIHFHCLVNDGQYEEILSYSELKDFLESMEDGEGKCNAWKS